MNSTNIAAASVVSGLLYYAYQKSLQEEASQKDLSLRTVLIKSDEQEEEKKMYTTKERLEFFGKGLAYAFVSTIGLALVARHCYLGYQGQVAAQQENTLKKFLEAAAIFGVEPAKEDYDLRQRKENVIKAKKLLYASVPIAYSYFMYKYRFIPTADECFKKAFHSKEAV